MINSELFPYKLTIFFTTLGFTAAIFYALHQAFKEIFANFFNKTKIIKQAKLLGFQIYPHFNTQQWLDDITNSGFLKHFFGNWKTINGLIKEREIKATATYKNHRVELLKFDIRTKTPEKDLQVGPFVGMHFNLHKRCHEVDIIYKKESRLADFVNLLNNTGTIKPKTWETESSEFNKYYNILSVDHITNLTVLTPDVMAKILDSKLKLNIEIMGNHLLIYTPNRFKKGNELETMLDIGYRIAENLE